MTLPLFGTKATRVLQALGKRKRPQPRGLRTSHHIPSCPHRAYVHAHCPRQIWHANQSRRPHIYKIQNKTYVSWLSWAVSTHPHSKRSSPFQDSRHFVWPSCQPTSSYHSLDEHPLTTPLDEFVQHHGQVLKDESADVEREELRRVPSAELETDLRLILVPKTRVFHLPGDEIYELMSAARNKDYPHSSQDGEGDHMDYETSEGTGARE